MVRQRWLLWVHAHRHSRIGAILYFSLCLPGSGMNIGKVFLPQLCVVVLTGPMGILVQLTLHVETKVVTVHLA